MQPAPEVRLPQARAVLSLGDVLRKNMAMLITLLLFSLGAYALYRLLAPLDMKLVIDSLRATPWHDYVPAVLAMIGAYAALVGYDWSALRFIGKPLPLPSVILGGFLGYAFGNTIGLSAVSGGAARYRIYAALGLNGYDIAAISSFAALAYGTGATLIGLGALALYPTALVGIWNVDPAQLQLWAGLGLVGTVAVMLGLSWHGGSIRLGRFRLRCPSIPDLSRQLFFTATDVCLATLVLYVLLPEGAVPYTYLLAVYAIATMVGIASHVPGGVGVFESVVIAALPAGLHVNDAVTALLLFRLIYYLLPFIVALALLSVIEVWTATGRRQATLDQMMPVFSAGRAIIPMAVGFLVLSAGLFMLFAGLLPNPRLSLEELEAILPLAMISGGAMVSSLIGSMLVVLALGLFRRSWGAYWLVMAILLAGIALALVSLQDLQRVSLLIVFAGILIPCRREFYRAPRIAQGLWSVQWVAFILAMGGVTWLTFYAIHESAPFATLSWWQFALAPEAAQAQRAMMVAGIVLSAAFLFSALGARRFQVRSPDTTTLAHARVILNTAGQGRDMRALSGDKLLMFSPRWDAVLSYGIQGASWVALGAPVGQEAGCDELAWEFHDAARAAGARPVFYDVGPDFADQAIEMGLAMHRMGDEAVVDLTALNPTVPIPRVSVLYAPHSAAFLAEMQALSADWLARHASTEKRFSTGRLDGDYLSGATVLALRNKAKLVAFAVIQRPSQAAASLELLREAEEAPADAAAQLITAAMIHVKGAGATSLSLGMAPYDGPGQAGPSLGLAADLAMGPAGDLWARFGALAFDHDARFVSSDDQRAFLAQFTPVWQPRYFCCRSVLPPRDALNDTARLIVGTARGLEEPQRS